MFRYCCRFVVVILRLVLFFVFVLFIVLLLFTCCFLVDLVRGIWQIELKHIREQTPPDLSRHPAVQIAFAVGGVANGPEFLYMLRNIGATHSPDALG